VYRGGGGGGDRVCVRACVPLSVHAHVSCARARACACVFALACARACASDSGFCRASSGQGGLERAGMVLDGAGRRGVDAGRADAARAYAGSPLFRLHIHWSLPSHCWLHTARHAAMRRVTPTPQSARLASCPAAWPDAGRKGLGSQVDAGHTRPPAVMPPLAARSRLESKRRDSDRGSRRTRMEGLMPDSDGRAHGGIIWRSDALWNGAYSALLSQSRVV
jgi:hypothetical protein